MSTIKRSRARASARTGKAPAFDQTRTTVAVTVRIHNVYVGGRDVHTTTTTTLPAPHADAAGREGWAFDHLHPLTGTGDIAGTDAGYFVTVLEASDPTLVGAEFEWGV